MVNPNIIRFLNRDSIIPDDLGDHEVANNDVGHLVQVESAALNESVGSDSDDGSVIPWCDASSTPGQGTIDIDDLFGVSL